MRSVIPGYYLPNDEQLANIWSKCIFIFDANVLLNLYSYEKAAKDDFIKLLKEIRERCWIPYQVALEFQRNRLRLLAEKKGVFYKANKAIETSLSTLKSKFDEIDIQKRHPSLDVDKLLEEIKALIDKFKTELKNHEDEQPGVRSVDELRIAIDEIFEGRIGVRPENQTFLDAIYTDGDFRYKNKIPPGYMDRSKDSDSDGPEFYFGGLRYDRKYGDLIIWKQIIANALSRGWENVIFVTDDSKEDWWQKFDAQGEKVIGPRPELIEEIAGQGGVDYFYMYSSPDFMRAANKFIGTKVEESTIEEADKVKDEYLKGFLWDVGLDNSHVSKSTAAHWVNKWINKEASSKSDLKDWVFNYDNRVYRHFNDISFYRNYYTREITRLNINRIIVLAKKNQKDDKFTITNIIGSNEINEANDLANILEGIGFENESDIKLIVEQIFSVPVHVITSTDISVCE